MKIILKPFILGILSIGCLITNAQVGGNQLYATGSNSVAYANNTYRNTTKQKQTFAATDSTLTIYTSILMVQEANSYLVSFGLNQEAGTVLECNKKINERLKKAKENLKSLGIEEEHFFVDFVSQTKVYDYGITKESVEQFQTGFEIKKNLLIRLDNIDALDKMLEICAEQEIYDLIQVEYRNTDVESIYLDMFDLGVDFIHKRKNLYLKTTGAVAEKKPVIHSDYFFQNMPKNMYAQYVAKESATLRNDSRYYKHNETFYVKEMRKNKTFYYTGVPPNGFDIVQDEVSPKIGIQYVLQFAMTYKLKKEKS